MKKKLFFSFIFFAIILFSSLVLLAFLMGSNLLAYKPPTRADNEQVNKDVLFEKVNTWRKKSNLTNYTKDKTLCKISDIRVNQIKDDWSHDQFYEITNSIDELSKFNQIGENLSKDIANEDVILDRWLSSASHSAILHKDYIYSCISCDNNYCVQLFAK